MPGGRIGMEAAGSLELPEFEVGAAQAFDRCIPLTARD